MTPLLATLLVTAPAAFAVGRGAPPAPLRPRPRRGRRPGGVESRSLLLSFGLLFVLQNGAPADLERRPQGIQLPRRPRARSSAPSSPPTASWRRRWPSGSHLAFYVYPPPSLAGKAMRALMQEPDGARLVGIDVHAPARRAASARASRCRRSPGRWSACCSSSRPSSGLPYTVTALVVVIAGRARQRARQPRWARCSSGSSRRPPCYVTASDIRVIASYAVLVADPDPPAVRPLWPLRLASGGRAGRRSRAVLAAPPPAALVGCVRALARARDPGRHRARRGVGAVLRADLAVPLARHRRVLRRGRVRDARSRAPGSPWPLPVAGGRGGGGRLMALLVGVLALRLRGPYFAVFTFGLAELAKHSLIWYETERHRHRRAPDPRAPGAARLYYTVLVIAGARRR